MSRLPARIIADILARLAALITDKNGEKR